MRRLNDYTIDNYIRHNEDVFVFCMRDIVFSSNKNFNIDWVRSWYL